MLHNSIFYSMTPKAEHRHRKAATPASWKKGQSGNPKGAPKKPWRWAEVIRTVAERMDKSGKEYKVAIAEALLKEALKGNVAAIKEIGDRIDGKAKQAIEMTGTDKEPIDISPLVALRISTVLKKRNLHL
jgi:hypothetical protein